MARLEENAAQCQLRLEEKLHEVVQLSSQLDTLREESARQVARTKERCESVRRTFMGQVAELERQLAQSRALAQTAQKDRNEVCSKMVQSAIFFVGIDRYFGSICGMKLTFLFKSQILFF